MATSEDLLKFMKALATHEIIKEDTFEKMKDWAKSSLNVTPSDHSLLLKPEERREFRAQVLKFRSTKPIFIIHSPGDEEYFGGCVSAGRGFAHPEEVSALAKLVGAYKTDLDIL